MSNKASRAARREMQKAHKDLEVIKAKNAEIFKSVPTRTDDNTVEYKKAYFAAIGKTTSHAEPIARILKAHKKFAVAMRAFDLAADIQRVINNDEGTDAFRMFLIRTAND